MASGIQFYVVDLETNGLSTKLHEVCQISIIRCSDRMQYTRNIKVDKVENSSYDALRVIGKSMDDLRKGHHKSDVIRETEVFLSEDKAEPSHRCFVGHNVSFDRKFLWTLWEKYNRKLPCDLYLDTVHMFKDFCKKNGIAGTKSNLTIACETAGIKKLGSAHDAKIDTRHTYMLWDKLSETIDFMDHIKCLPHNLE